jgi:hypothetical protein
VIRPGRRGPATLSATAMPPGDGGTITIGRWGPPRCVPSSPDVEVVSGGRGMAMAAGAISKANQGRGLRKSAIITLRSAALQLRKNLPDLPIHLLLTNESWRCMWVLPRGKTDRKNPKTIEPELSTPLKGVPQPLLAPGVTLPPKRRLRPPPLGQLLNPETEGLEPLLSQLERAFQGLPKRRRKPKETKRGTRKCP